MTSRQSGWHRPGDAQRALFLAKNHLCGGGQVVSPQRGGVPHSGGGRAQRWLAPCMNRRKPLGLSTLLAYNQPLHGGLSLLSGSSSQQTSLCWGSPICFAQPLCLPVTSALTDLSKLGMTLSSRARRLRTLVTGTCPVAQVSESEAARDTHKPTDLHRPPCGGALKPSWELLQPLLPPNGGRDELRSRTDAGMG